jgi:hypothetical protein
MSSMHTVEVKEVQGCLRFKWIFSAYIIIARQSLVGRPAGSVGRVTLSNIVLLLLSYNVSVHRCT